MRDRKKSIALLLCIALLFTIADGKYKQIQVKGDGALIGQVLSGNQHYSIEADLEVSGQAVGFFFSSKDGDWAYFWQFSTVTGSRIIRPHYTGNYLTGAPSWGFAECTPNAPFDTAYTQTAFAEQEHHIKIDVFFNKVKTYIEGNLVNTFTSFDFANHTPAFNEFGFRLGTDAEKGYVDNYKVTYYDDSNIPHVKYDFNFNDGVNPFKLLDGKVATPSDRCEIVNGRLLVQTKFGTGTTGEAFYLIDTENYPVISDRVDLAENAKVVGGISNMTVSWMPTLQTIQAGNEGKEVYYEIYMNDDAEPTRIITDPTYVTRESVRVEAEEAVMGETGSVTSDQYEQSIIAKSIGGQTPRFSNIEMPDVGAFEMTARYATNQSSGAVTSTLQDVSTGGNIASPSFPATLEHSADCFREVTTTLGKTYVESNSFLLSIPDLGATQLYLDWIEFSRPVYHYRIDMGDVTGRQRVKIITHIVDGEEEVTDQVYSQNHVEVHAQVEDVLTSSQITVQGYQVRMYDGKMGFRTKSQAPAVGQDITVKENGVDTVFQVQDVGTIYSIDDNVSGLMEKDLLDESCTLLDQGRTATGTDVDGNTIHMYRGYEVQNKYSFGVERTLGFLATEENGYFEEEDGFIPYANAIVGIEEILHNTLWIRPFVVAKNKSTEEVKLIYSSDIESVSMLEVANYLYMNSLAANYTGHDYLYDYILTTYDYKYYDNPFFVDKYNKVDYGWNDNLYRPES